MSEIKVINDERGVESRPRFVIMSLMWIPIARNYINGGSDAMKVQDVRARYYNQDTCEAEEVEVVQLLNMEGFATILCTKSYLSTTYAHIRRANGEELHVEGSLICKQNERGHAVPDYIL